MPGKRTRSNSYSSNKKARYSKPRHYKKKSIVNRKYRDPSARIPETKYVDTLLNYAVANTTTGVLLNPIAEGSDNNQRIGKSIRMKSIHLRAAVGGTTAVLAEDVNYPIEANTIRMLVVVDKQCNNGLPNIGQVLDTLGAPNAFFNPFKSRNMSWLDRFDVLIDEMVTVCHAGPNAMQVDRFTKIDLPAKYVDDTATYPASNGLFFWAVDMNQDVGNSCDIIGSIRLNFFDD